MLEITKEQFRQSRRDPSAPVIHKIMGNEIACGAKVHSFTPLSRNYAYVTCKKCMRVRYGLMARIYKRQQKEGKSNA